MASRLEGELGAQDLRDALAYPLAAGDAFEQELLARER
jgi:hypothetical protein